MEKLLETLFEAGARPGSFLLELTELGGGSWEQGCRVEWRKPLLCRKIGMVVPGRETETVCKEPTENVLVETEDSWALAGTEKV